MSSAEPPPFGALLRRGRAAAGLTQARLAARVGLSPAAVAALERGRRRAPRGATVVLLADALGLDGGARAELVAAARDGAAARATERSRVASGAAQGAPDGPRRPPWWLTGQPTPLVDRAQELELITRLLRDGGVRLLTLTGPAGVGKTRLALAAAAQVADDADRFPDGVALVDLAPVRDPASVLGAVARALGLLDAGSRPLPERLVDALAQRRRLLVVLDNFEQVLPAAALLADLLGAYPHLALLVTSRAPLQVRWEQTLRVAPLPVPDLREPLPPPEALLAVPSVALFVGRARARRPDFAYTARQAPLVARLAAQLDGLPLALELAAARLDVLSLPALARRLGDRLRLLSSEAPDRPARQRSLEAAVGWSYDLLSAPERRLFRCLGVFAGRVTLDAIDAVAAAVRGVGAAGRAADGGEPAAAREPRDGGRTLRGLLSLAEKSLVLPMPTRPEGPDGPPGQPGHAGGPPGAQEAEDDDADEDPEPAFGMLETVREYAWERLAAQGELAAARRSHARYFLALAERAEPILRGRDQRAWYRRLEREHDNLRAALRWLLDRDDRGDPHTAAEGEAGLRLAAALGIFWVRRGYYAEAGRWLEAALARAPQGAAADPTVRARTLVAAGHALLVQGAGERARAVLEEGLALAERHGIPTAIADAHIYLGVRAVLAGDAEAGARLLREALRRWEALGNPERLGETLFSLGLAADATGDAAAAAARYADSLRQAEAAGDEQLAAFVRCFLGVAEWKRGALPSAVEHVRAAVRTSVALRDRSLLSHGVRAAVALVGARGEPVARWRLLGAADALAEATGATFEWRRLPEAQQVMGPRPHPEGELGAAFREGRALPFGAVAALALTLLEEAARVLPDQEAAPGGVQALAGPSRPPDGSPLTAREREVLRLVARGLSSRAIGRELFLAPSTVTYHLSSVFNKLGVGTRAQAVAVAARRGLV
jgi:non-specific serine/threonine protein kinase